MWRAVRDFSEPANECTERSCQLLGGFSDQAPFGLDNKGIVFIISCEFTPKSLRLSVITGLAFGVSQALVKNTKFCSEAGDN